MRDETYRVEYRDSSGRWHVQRGSHSLASAAIRAAEGREEWRVVDAYGNVVAWADTLLEGEEEEPLS